MQSIAETCVHFDAAHLSIILVSEIAVPMFTTLMAGLAGCPHVSCHCLDLGSQNTLVSVCMEVHLCMECCGAIE